MSVLVAIMAGLGTRHSEGIIVTLADTLREIPGVTVLTGSYAEYEDFANELANRAAGHRVIVGHSLGGSVAPLTARIAGVPIAAIFGFDPAGNAAANASRYGLTPVPTNVRVARAGIATSTVLGGGRYVADNESVTLVENWDVPAGHLNIDKAIAEHLVIDETVRRLAGAPA